MCVCVCVHVYVGGMCVCVYVCVYVGGMCLGGAALNNAPHVPTFALLIR